MLDRERIVKYLDKYQDTSRAFKDEASFEPGICHVQLGNYDEAKGFFEKSIGAMFNPRTLWKGSGQCQWLVAVCILSGRADLYAGVQRELDIFRCDFKLKNKRESLFAVFADAVMELLLPEDEGISSHIQELLSRPKAKDMYAAGLALQAILDNDQTRLENSLEQLLRVHEGQAKHGDLRWTAEGFLCLPAMALAYVALKRNLQVNITNDYLNLGYLEFLLN